MSASGVVSRRSVSAPAAVSVSGVARRTRGVFAAARRLAGLTLVSRVLGFARDTLMAGLVGAGGCADAFLLAWTLPNLGRRVLGEGAFASALVPAFVEARGKGDEGAARRLVGGAVVRLGVGLALLTLLLELACAGGRAWAGPGRVDLALDLVQVFLPYLPFVCLAGVLGGALHALGRMAVPAMAPVVLNVAWIGALLLLGPLVEDPVARVRLLACALTVTGGVELLAHLRAMRAAGVPVEPATPDPETWARVRRLFAALALGAGLLQANALVDQVVAYAFVPEGGTSALFYANRLVQLPVGVLGVALSTALFPELSRRAKAGDLAGAGALVDRGVAVAAFVALPAALGLAALAGPLVEVLFRRGAFDAAAAARTAWATLLLSPAVVAACATPVITRAFHAEEDARAPLRVSAACVALNVALAVALVRPLGEAGLALATSISQLTALAGLGLVARRRRVARGERPEGAALMRGVARSLGLSLVMALVAMAVHRLAPGGDVVRLVLAIVAGAACYGGGALLLRAPEARALLGRGS